MRCCEAFPRIWAAFRLGAYGLRRNVDGLIVPVSRHHLTKMKFDPTILT